MTFYTENELNRDRNKFKVDCQKAIEEGEPTLVEQNHKAETDINNIVKKHAGNLELIAKNQQLVEFTMDDIPTNDFQEMMQIMVNAKEAFQQVPSQIRKEFDNDAAKYLDFVRNPENKDRLIELGLAHAPEEIDKSPIPVVIKESETE